MLVDITLSVSAKLYDMFQGYQKSSMQLSFIRIIQILSKELVHSEHVNSFSLEHRLKSIVASNPSFIARFLEVVLVDILPDSLDRLRPRQLVRISCCLIDDLQTDGLPGARRRITPTMVQINSMASTRR